MSKEFYSTLQLASKGFFYDGALPEGRVNLIEPWGTEEERLLLSPSLDFDETFDRLVKRCTDCPIPPGKLLLADRQHLFLFMRCQSYGGDYSFSFQCSECREKSKHSMDLEKNLDVTYADDEELLESLDMSPGEIPSEPFVFELPVQKKMVGWRLLRGEDEQNVKRYVKQQKAKRGKGGRDRVDYQYRLALRIVEVDGEPLKLSDAMDLVRTLKGKDALAIRQEIQAISFGVDMEIEAKCSECGYPNDILVPMDQSFFRPEGRVARG